MRIELGAVIREGLGKKIKIQLNLKLMHAMTISKVKVPVLLPPAMGGQKYKISTSSDLIKSYMWSTNFMNEVKLIGNIRLAFNTESVLCMY